MRIGINPGQGSNNVFGEESGRECWCSNYKEIIGRRYVYIFQGARRDTEVTVAAAGCHYCHNVIRAGAGNEGNETVVLT